MSYLVVEKMANKITQATTYKVKKLGRRKVEIRVELKAGVKENPFQCENRIGMLEVLAKLFTKKLAHVDHPVCVHKGGQFCQYIVSWEKTPSYVWKLIQYYSFGFEFAPGGRVFFCLAFLLLDLAGFYRSSVQPGDHHFLGVCGKKGTDRKHNQGK